MSASSTTSSGPANRSSFFGLVAFALQRVLLFVVVLSHGLGVWGYSADKVPATGKLEQIEDVPDLPRVLIIGDSISMGYGAPLRKLLAGKANLHRSPGNCFTTTHTLKHLKEWVGNQQWDVIHFNCGLHDIKVEPDGSRQVSLADYERNLRAIVQDLKPLTEPLIWCSTTPVPGSELDPPRRNEDVIAYNAAARRVMAEHAVPINDLYAFVFPQADHLRKPLNVHFTPKGSEVLALQVASCIEQALAAKSGSRPD